MLYTLEAVRDNVRNRDGKRVFYLASGDQLTSSARDYLSRERIEILPAEQARVERYALLGGGYVTDKPEHMTHLNASVLVSKTHPRIAFRGAMDTLEAELLLAQAVSTMPLRGQLGEVLELARKLIRCDVLDEPVEDKPLCGMTQQQLRERSHFPQKFYAQPHFMPSADDGEVILHLNRVRCAARHAELMAVHAFTDRDGAATREDILRALNRMSSAVYIFMIEQKAKRQKE